MTVEEVADWLMAEFSPLAPKPSWGEMAFFVNPENRLPSGVYFATLKTRDGAHDRASGLDTENRFRLNFGPGRALFEKQFGPPPKRPPAGAVIDGPWDFTKEDVLTPHPVYGWMSWMAIKNPSHQTLTAIHPLLDAAYRRACDNARKRLRKA